MSAAGRFDALARRYGQPVTLLDANGNRTASGYGFVQPYLTESRDYLWRTPSKAGRFDGARFRFLGQAALGEETGDFDRLTCLGQTFRFQTAQPVRIGTRTAYWWGVLVPEDGEDDCG